MDEWGGNFDLGTKDEHQGFNEAACLYIFLHTF